MTQQSELNLQGIDFEEGYIAVIDKPLEWTSSDVVRKIKFALRRAGYPKIKVGHAGTLDPLATGILLVCIGKATKMADALQAEEKEYVADLMLGATTPSFDLEHPIDRTYPLRTYHARSGRGGTPLAHRRTAANPAPLFGQEGRRRPGLRAGPRGRRGGTAQSAHQHLRNGAHGIRPAPHPHPGPVQQGDLHPFAGRRDRPGARQRCAPHLALPHPQRRFSARCGARIELFSRKTAKS